MNPLRQIFSTCYSFDSYTRIVHQSRIKSFLYFFILVLSVSVLIYPRFFKQQSAILFPVLEEVAAQFPDLEFRDSEIVTPFKSPMVIHNPFLSIVIDPSGSFRSESFLRAWILFSKKAFQLNFRTETGQFLAYNNPSVMRLFQLLADFEKGSGTLQGDFFIRFKEAIQQEYFSWGILFFLNLLVLGFIGSLVLAFMGYFYSRMIDADLNWAGIRNISYYAITPVLLLMMVCHYCNLGVTRLQPVFFLAYLLFLFGAIQRFKIPEENDYE